MRHAVVATAVAFVIIGGTATRGAAGRRDRQDPACPRDLRREPQLRSSLRHVSRRQRPRQRDARAVHADRPRRHPAAGAATRMEAAGRRPRVPAPDAQPAVPPRRTAARPAAVAASAKPCAPVLPEHRADQRRPQQPVRRGVGCGGYTMGYYDGSTLPLWSGRASTRWPTVSSWGRSAARTSITNG